VAAPSVAISYAATSAMRICVYSSDQNFSIRLWRANSDLGLGVTTGANIVGDFPGTSTYVDDTFPSAARSASTTRSRPYEDVLLGPSSIYGGSRYSTSRTDTQTTGASYLVTPAGDSIVLGATYWYAAQLIPTSSQVGYTDGAMTPWQSMTATAGTPGACTCTIPTVVPSSSDIADVGTLTLTITDAQNRVQMVEFQTQAGFGPLSDWTEDTAAPYTTTVSTLGADVSRINYRVTYLDCAGASVSNLSGTVEFP
jgi:hypothetical protein